MDSLFKTINIETKIKINYVPVSVLPFEVSILIPVSERLILNVIYSESIYDMVGGCL